MRWRTRGAAALAALLLVSRLGLAFPAAAQTVSAGGTERRELGPLAVTVEVDSVRAQVRVTLALAGEMVGQAMLAPDAPAYQFDVQAGGAAAAGTLSLQWAPGALLSALQADLSTRSGPGPPEVFRGSVSTWAWPDTLPWVDQRFWLAPELSVRTRVRGAAGAAATVTVYAGETPMFETSVMQASPVAIVPADLVVGDTRVTAGTSFTLTIATPMQQGLVLMTGRFQTRTTPETPIAAAIATWRQ